MFKKAERKKAKLRLAICGPSGSGKTYSSLLIASGLGGKIAVIDTEHGSASLYAGSEGIPEYDTVELKAPYSPERYIECIKAAERSGYDVLIIDSLTHAWASEGGILDMADKAAKGSRSGNTFNAWREVTPHHNKLVEAILQSSMHIIVTIRTKVDYEVSKGSDGKTSIKKVGLAPVQREGLDYEFTTVLDLSVDGHIATASKDRTRLFDGKFSVPSKKMGEELINWLNSGIEDPSVSIREELIANAMAVAEEGVDSLRSYWESITEEQRIIIGSEKLADLKKIAQSKEKQNEV